MIAFRQILCPIDFSDHSLRALAHAAAIASWYDAVLEVLHVRSDNLETRRGLDSASPTVTAGLEEDDRIAARLQAALEAAGAPALKARPAVLPGHPHQVIVARARERHVDLLVVGTHGRGGFNRLFLGSVAEKVIRTAECPVLTIPRAAPGPAATSVTFKRIVCAVDHSPSSREALRYGLELARSANGVVTVLYALEYMDPDEPCEHVDHNTRQRRHYFIDHARTRLHAAVESESATWCDIEEKVVIDRAYRAILREAAESKAELIVMGAQGTTGAELMLYGSNTQHVVRAASCPVLTVRA